MTFTTRDHECMALALKLARKGLYTTDPNPRVGCVIADGTRIVGQGWHEAAGGAHAEIAALNDAGEPVSGMTAYVTLEPCSHHGRTPPCTEALIAAGIARVVVPTEDPHHRVDGGGMQALREAGVTVESGLMTGEAERLNAGYMKRMRTGRPWVRIKSALSLDGRTALRNGDSKWISGIAARQDVQRWRARSSAILTGIGTVLADDPELTVRLSGPAKQPMRVVTDSRWRTDAGCKLLKDAGSAMIAGVGQPPRELVATGAKCVSIPGAESGLDLEALVDELGRMELNEVQVEAGARLCGSLLEAGLVDEVLMYMAPVLLGDGGPGPFAIGPLEYMEKRSHFRVLETVHIGEDLRLLLQPQNL